jgi:hypothetical protein
MVCEKAPRQRPTRRSSRRAYLEDLLKRQPPLADTKGSEIYFFSRPIYGDVDRPGECVPKFDCGFMIDDSSDKRMEKREGKTKRKRKRLTRSRLVATTPESLMVPPGLTGLKKLDQQKLRIAILRPKQTTLTRRITLHLNNSMVLKTRSLRRRLPLGTCEPSSGNVSI